MSVLDVHTIIDDLIQSSLGNELYGELRWFSHSDITDIKPSRIDTIHYAVYRQVQGNYTVDETTVMLLLLDSGETRTPTLMSELAKIYSTLLGNTEMCISTCVTELARIYSLPTNKYDNNNENFKRYSSWLASRNAMIWGFTKYENKYYMVAHSQFYHCYSRYGFCSECGRLRCSQVWCICGHKQLSDGWTSNNKLLDEFIKKSQMRTNSANEAYLEWFPFDCIKVKRHRNTARVYCDLELIPLEITNETDKSYYDKLCDKYPDILTKNVWIIIGFTYDTIKQKYCLLREYWKRGLCLACQQSLEPDIKAFCYHCKAPRPLGWTTGNKPLDSFIMESWNNVTNTYDAYIQWIEYSLLTNVQDMTLLRHKSTHVAEWLDPITNVWTRVLLKKIVDGQDIQSFDFYQITKMYPEILTPDNIWIIGVTQEPSTQRYYLVFYPDIHALLDKFMQTRNGIGHLPYADFDEIEEIGSGGYGTAYTAKYKVFRERRCWTDIVVLKRFKNFNKTPELFISEFKHHASCVGDFLQIYGVTQDPETKEYMIVMQHANKGNLLSYLDQNIKTLSWRMKLHQLRLITIFLHTIHKAGFIHCDLHGGNIVLREHTGHIQSFICDLGLSRSVHSSESTIRGVLPFIAPEVFHTYKFTQKSDIYSFGIIMHLMATGEPPFRDREFDGHLLCDIMGGLRPPMPDSAPEQYKKLAQRCCDADPDKRPDARTLLGDIDMLLEENDNTWNTVYYNEVKPLSRLEKESKYSSTLLPTGSFPKPRNSYDSLIVTLNFDN